MLQLLLMVFMVIGSVCSQLNCPIYSDFENDPSLTNEINGTFYKIFATGANTAQCQRQTFTIGPNNNIVGGYLQSPDWCLSLTNCTSNPDHHECDIVPITNNPLTLTSLQRNSIKLVEKIGSGKNLCIVYTYCRSSEDGLYVLCRQPPKLLSLLLLEVLELLGSLINSLTSVPYLRVVNQVNCNLLNCPPST